MRACLRKFVARSLPPTSFVVLLLAAALAMPAQAATWVVSPGMTIGEVIAATPTASGDEIVVMPGTYPGFDYTDGATPPTVKSVWVHSASGPSVTFINGAVTAVNGQSDAAILEGFTLTNAGGAGVIVASALQIRSNVITGCSGAGISIGGGSPAVTQNSISLNNAGGVSISAGASPSIVLSSIFNNKNGGINVSSSSVTVGQCSIYSNTSSLGGGISASGGSSVTVTSSSIMGNSASGGGGGIAGQGDGLTISLSGTNLSDNQTTAAGGGAYVVGNPAVLNTENCTVTANSANAGGGVYLSSGGPSLFHQTLFEYNTATGAGGGAYIAGSGAFRYCRFSQNAAGTDGGALAVGGGPTLRNCTIESNTASGEGGAIYSQASVAQITSNYIHANQAARGGAIVLRGSEFVNYNYISQNTASAEDGGIRIVNALNPMVSDNELRANVSLTGGGGLSILGDLTYARVYDNLFESNQAGSGSVQGIGGGIRIQTGPNSYPKMQNNTFWGNSVLGPSGGIGAGLFIDVQGPFDFVNNIIASNGVGGGIYGTPRSRPLAYAFNNDVWGNVGFDWGGSLGDLATINGDFSADPLFAKGPAGDFYLSQTASGQSLNSPCLNRGTTTVMPPDLSGATTRTDGAADSGAVDVGYHYRFQDDDGDGLPNLYELTPGIGTHPWSTRHGIPGLDRSYNPEVPDSATDQCPTWGDFDGLTVLQEYRLRTNPQDFDTDNDGLADGDELIRGTDPANPDTDADGVIDGDEVNVYYSDPLAANTGIYGLVTRADNGHVLEGATVKLLQQGAVVKTVQTLPNGAYRADVSAGAYDVACSKSGFISDSRSAVVVTTGKVSLEAFSLTGAATVTVQSTSLTGIWVGANPSDMDGKTSGTTNFTRGYGLGTNVTLTAASSYTKSGLTYLFDHWNLDGADQPQGQQSLQVAMSGDHLAIAEYALPARVLTLQSTPASGIWVGTAPLDSGGRAGGNTTFTRSYRNGTPVKVSATPSFTTSGHTYLFNRWAVDGTDQPQGERTITIPMLANHTLVAKYALAIRTLSVSSTPLTGIWVGVGPADRNGQGSGNTNFTRSYDNGVLVKLTPAPNYTKNGIPYTFDRWNVDGVDQPQGQQVMYLAMSVNHSAIAKYTLPVRTLTVQSTPITGPWVGISPADKDGSSSGYTNFTRSYDFGTSVNLTASASFTKLGVTYAFDRWAVDGTDQPQGERTISQVMLADHTLTAKYKLPVLTLSVSSTPVTGIWVGVGPADKNGQGSGTTNFTRSYDSGAVVKLTSAANYTKNGLPYTFDRWNVDGVDQPQGQQVIYVTMSADHSATAKYTLPEQTLSVNCALPGVPVQVSPADNNDQGDGNTNFTRTYPSGAVVSLTAPATVSSEAASYVFDRWAVDGTNQPKGQRTISVTMSADRSATAKYLQVVNLEVQSTPVTGLWVGASPADLGGLGGGATNYARQYVLNTAVSLTATATYTKEGITYLFDHWTLDGVDQSSGQRTLAVSMSGDRIAVANYQYVVTLAVKSSPITGIAVTVSPADKDGQSNGTTNFTRSYYAGATTVELSAPASQVSGGTLYNFYAWNVDGVEGTVGQQQLSVVMDQPHTVTALYRGPRTLTVSSTPVSGVSVVVSRIDLNGLQDGVTTFTRTYPSLTALTLIAPTSFTSGGVSYGFDHWRVAGVDQPVGQRSVDITMVDNTSAVAVYLVASP